MQVDAGLLWRHFGRTTHQEAVRQLGFRMAHSASPLVITSHEALPQKVKEPPPATADFLAAAQALLATLGPDKAATLMEAAKLFALRSIAAGQATSLLSAVALRLYIGDASADGLHGLCAAGFEALQSSAPLRPEMEAYMPFLTQLETALDSLPSQRGTYFVGLNVQTPSGKLAEALNGERGIGSFYPGGLIAWRGCASVTADPMLAKEVATGGPGAALVLKIRSVTSRDVSAFSAAPDLGERLFLPRRRFRVAGIYALEDMFLRRGLAMSGSRHVLLEAFETPDLSALTGSSALSWEAACGRRAACVVLDEEEHGGATAH
ncbi:unnamed protein product [Prorocentrum cordatum]|uniref:Mono(ADP-ribosyl)transferase n=1 Tax=Prorocentrum cordatum TaxID=2364126 RepID=A0ABN9V5P6_9DINO|nr:unnamed protein product [Polarella glacialis]